MASGPPDVTASQETAETPEECQGKKKSKFQTFKNFFVKKKRKEAPAPTGESPLKSSQSSDNVNGPEATPTQSHADQDSGSNVNMGNKAMSHDSVFVSDSHSSEANEGLASSQDSLHGKVKSLQMQLKQAIRLGSPPSLLCGKKGDDAGALSEDDGLPCSPPEISPLHTVLTASTQGRSSSLSLEGSDSEDDQMSLEASSRLASPLVSLPLDFSEPANFTACLNNSAARHRIAVKQRACAKRKPASRETVDSSKVKILSGRVPLRVEKEPSSAVITEPSAEEENKDVVMTETDGGGEDSAAEVSAKARPASERMEEDSAAPEEPAEAEHKGEDGSSSSSESELDGEKSLPAVEPALDLQGHPTDTDSEDEVPPEETGSLLQEVLSSLECPLTSAFVLKPEAQELQVSEVQDEGSPVDNPLDDPTDEPSSSPAEQQEHDEEEEGVLPPAIDMSCGLASRDEDEQQADGEERVESDEGEDEEAEEEEGPAEGLCVKEPDLPADDPEEAEEQEQAVEDEVMEQEEMMEQEEVMVQEEQEAVVEVVEEKQEAVLEEALVEEVEEGDSIMEEAHLEEMEEKEVVMEEAVEEEVEEEKVVMEEEKEAIEEDEVVIEKEVMQQQEEEEEEEEVTAVKEEVGGVVVGGELAPEAPADPEGEPEEDDDEEGVEDLKVEEATEIQEPEDPEESMEAGPEPDSGELDSGEDDAQDILSESWSYSHTGSVERSEIITELFPAEFGEDTSPPQPLGVAISPCSEEPSTPADLSIRSADIAEELSSGPSLPEDDGNVADSAEPSKVRFTIAPAWQRSLSGGSPKEPSLPSPVKPEAFQEAHSETAPEPEVSPGPPQSPTALSSVRQPPAQDPAGAENPFGVKLRKTTVLLRYGSEGSGDSPTTGTPAELEEPIRRPQSGAPSAKPALPKKPDPLEDNSTAKLRKTSDSALSRGPAEKPSSPSWISVAKQKQKSFQENPIEETPGRKSSIETDEANLSSSPVTVSCSLEISKPAAGEKEGKRALAHSPPGQAGQAEPPWLALAKKKAKAWSEMPQIVQ